jgi:hypothetical protein
MALSPVNVELLIVRVPWLKTAPPKPPSPPPPLDPAAPCAVPPVRVRFCRVRLPVEATSNSPKVLLPAIVRPLLPVGPWMVICGVMDSARAAVHGAGVGQVDRGRSAGEQRRGKDDGVVARACHGSVHRRMSFGGLNRLTQRHLAGGRGPIRKRINRDGGGDAPVLQRLHARLEPLPPRVIRQAACSLRTAGLHAKQLAQRVEDHVDFLLKDGPDENCQERYVTLVIQQWG